MARSHRLTNDIKAMIAEAALIKAFGERLKVIRANRAQLAQDILEDVLGEHKAAFDGLPVDLKDSATGFQVNFAGSHAYLGFSGSDRNTYYAHSNRDIDMPSNVRVSVPKSLTGNAPSPKFDGTHSFTYRFQAIESDQKVIGEEIKQTRVSVRAVLDGCSTVKALIETWPEVKELVPAEALLPIGTGKSKVPAVLMENLNSKIGLPTETEGAAA